MLVPYDVQRDLAQNFRDGVQALIGRQEVGFVGRKLRGFGLRLCLFAPVHHLLDFALDFFAGASIGAARMLHDDLTRQHSESRRLLPFNGFLDDGDEVRSGREAVQPIAPLRVEHDGLPLPSHSDQTREASAHLPLREAQGLRELRHAGGAAPIRRQESQEQEQTFELVWAERRQKAGSAKSRCHAQKSRRFPTAALRLSLVRDVNHEGCLVF